MIARPTRNHAVGVRNVLNGSLYIAIKSITLARTVNGHITAKNEPDTKKTVPRFGWSISVALTVEFILLFVFNRFYSPRLVISCQPCLRIFLLYATLCFLIQSLHLSGRFRVNLLILDSSGDSTCGVVNGAISKACCLPACDSRQNMLLTKVTNVP